MKEIWKDVKGWEGRYQISNFGRVKRATHIRVSKNGARRLYGERACTPKKNIHGYIIVQLWEGGKPCHKQIHRLLAETFIPNPSQLEQVNHKNGIKDDNRIENLEWVTRRENSLHAVYCLGKSGRPCKPIKCIETGKEYPSIHSASRDTGISTMCISRVANGERNHTNNTHWVFL